MDPEKGKTCLNLHHSEFYIGLEITYLIEFPSQERIGHSRQLKELNIVKYGESLAQNRM